MWPSGWLAQNFISFTKKPCGHQLKKNIGQVLPFICCCYSHTTCIAVHMRWMHVYVYLTLVLINLRVWIPLALAHLSGKMLLLLELDTQTHMNTHTNAITKVKMYICKLLSSYLINEFKFWWGTLLECRQKEGWHVYRFYKHNQIPFRTASMMQRELHKSQAPMLCITIELPHLSWGKRKKKTKKLNVIQIKMIVSAENIVVSSPGWLIVLMQDYLKIIGWILWKFLGRQ